MLERGNTKTEGMMESGEASKVASCCQPKKGEDCADGPFACPFAKHDPRGHSQIEEPCTNSKGFKSIALME